MSEEPRWPHVFPFFRFMALLLALAALIPLITLWQHHVPLPESYDLKAYALTQVPGPFKHTYSVLEYGRNLAVPSDPGTFTLQTRAYDREKLHEWLRDNVYAGQPIWRVLRWPLAGAGVVLLLLFPIGAWLEDRINREARDGRLIRGPQIVSHWRWNLRTWGKARNFYVETE